MTWKIPAGGFEIGLKTGSAAVSRNPIASSYIILDVINFIMLLETYILKESAEQLTRTKFCPSAWKARVLTLTKG